LDVYGEVNSPDLQYPYPPGYIPYLGLVAQTGDAFRVLGRLPPILADAVLAWVVQRYVRARGRSATEAIVAAGAIALSPIFGAVAGIEGQVDSVALLPAVFAVLAWDAEIRSRALLCGLLIGIGAAVKAFPIFFLLALLPTVRNRTV
jgi:4-amino-4-deoxy-L-arabinose transferase-like glycosyltransferase